MNTADSPKYIKIPGKDSVISLLNRFLGLKFDVLYSVTDNRYVDGNDIRLVNLGPSTLFITYKSTTSSSSYFEFLGQTFNVFF